MINKENKQIKGWIRFYYRLSRNEEQKQSILNYCNKNNIEFNYNNINSWIEIEFVAELGRDLKKSEDELKGLKRGDLLIVSELSSLSRSLTNLPRMIKSLWEKGIDLISVKEDLVFSQLNPQLVNPSSIFILICELDRTLERKRGVERIDKEIFQVGFTGKKIEDVRESYPRSDRYSMFDEYREVIISLLRKKHGYVRIRNEIGKGSSAGIKGYIVSRNLREEIQSTISK